MKTVLITGINGFLGSRLAKRLSTKYVVIGLGNELDNLFRIQSCGFKVYSSKNNLESVFLENRIDAVIHTATVYRSDSVRPLLDANIVLPVSLFDLAQKHGVSLFVNTDSFFTHTKNAGYEYLQEYTLSKQHALFWLKALQKKCTLVNMVIYHMFGENDSPAKFVSFLLQKLKANEDIDLTLGEQIRDFIYIEDVVSAFETIVDRSACFGEFNEFDVCSGAGTSIRELVVLMKDVVGSSSNLRFGKLAYRNNEIMSATGNPKGLLELGWKCKFLLKDGLRALAGVL